MAFGIAQKALTKQLKAAIRCESVNIPGHSFLFAFSKDDRTGQKSYWRCRSCRKLYASGNRGSVSSITIDNASDEILTDPEAGHHPDCQPTVNAVLEAQLTMQEAKKDLRRGSKRPREAYTAASASLAEKFGADDNYNDIVDAFGTYKKARRSLHRNGAHGIVPIDDLQILPECYQKTYLSRMNDALDDRWLLHSNDGILVFASQLDLQVLTNSTLWIMDGTFKVCPPPFKQLYTILGYGGFEKEAVPVVFALLRGKTPALYQELLTVVVAALRQRNEGQIGQLRTIICDFEVATHQAVRSVLPEVQLRGCLFHFCQALVKHFDGFKQQLANPENEITRLFGCIKALALVPLPLIHMTWSGVIQHQLNTLLPQLLPCECQKINDFITYFADTWLNNPTYPRDLWNHSDNDGPRTTNHAEGYHSLLNKSDIDQMHPSLAHFLTKLQCLHNRWQQQIGRLQCGAVAPEQGLQLYADLHNRILDARRNFCQRTQHLWNFPLFNSDIMDPIAYQFLCREIDIYLQHVKHLIGKKPHVQN